MFQHHRLFRLRRPRHGLLRVLGGLISIAALAALLVFGFVALLALATIGGVVYLVRQLQKPASVSTAASTPPPTGVIEGEYVVVREGSRAPQP